MANRNPTRLNASKAPPIAARMLQRKCACGANAASGDQCEECKSKAKQPLSAALESSGVPPIVQDVVRSPGQPLDAGTRSFFEPRYGHEFSKVRVHADRTAAESARAVGALAYTVGNDLVFGHDAYQPRTEIGRVLLAHELAHTVQQQNRTQDSPLENGALEREADSAAAAAMLNQPVALSSDAAPPIQFLKVTSGALGKALEVFTNQWSVPDRAIFLLQKSPTFMRLASVVDANYVWRGDSYKVDPTGESGPDGRLLKGPYKGRRELFDVLHGPAEFEPFQAAPEPGYVKVSGDVIRIQSTDVPGFISEVAHETAHAAQLVGASAPPPTTVQDEVNAAIRDEVGARTSEAKVLSELPGADIKAQAAKVGTRVPAEVERDISPAFGLTYVENAFFASRLREAQTKDGLTDDEASQVRDKVETEFKGKTLPKSGLHFKPNLSASGIYELSDYGDIWFNRRLAQEEWKQFAQNHNPTDADYAAQKENLVQDHAKRFFEGRVSYQVLPAPAMTAPATTPIRKNP
jgi:hypothetical protein